EARACMRRTTPNMLKLRRNCGRGLVEIHRAGGFGPAVERDAFYFAFCLRRAAQKAFMRRGWAFRCAAVMGRRPLRFTPGSAVTDAAALGGRPRRFVGP